MLQRAKPSEAYSTTLAETLRAGKRGFLRRRGNASAALKWALQDPNVHTTIPGCVTFEEMNIDLSVMEDLALTDSKKKYLQMGTYIPSLYCQGCGVCLKQCPEQLPIPDLRQAVHVHVRP
jgi:predicted aldo/keto reductase-like oxidoreductase